MQLCGKGSSLLKHLIQVFRLPHLSTLISAQITWEISTFHAEKSMWLLKNPWGCVCKLKEIPGSHLSPKTSRLKWGFSLSTPDKCQECGYLLACHILIYCCVLDILWHVTFLMFPAKFLWFLCEYSFLLVFETRQLYVIVGSIWEVFVLSSMTKITAGCRSLLKSFRMELVPNCSVTLFSNPGEWAGQSYEKGYLT